MYSRFLLSHLREPELVVEKWASQLEAGGLLLLEEAETIITSHLVFARYLEAVEAMLASQSNRLYAGPVLDGLDSVGRLKCAVNELRSVFVRNCDAARMFELNLNTWKDSEFVRTNYSSGFIRELEEDLQKIAAIESPAREISWQMRQSAILRDEHDSSKRGDG